MAARSFFQKQSFLSPCRIFTVVFVALLIFCLVLRHEIQAVFSAYRITSRVQYGTPKSENPSSSSPAFQAISAVFGKDPSLADTSALGDEAWPRKFQTPKGGFLWVRYNETLREGWGISMFHALHCLKMIRAELQHTWSIMDSTPATSHSPDPVHEAHRGDVDHMKHCLAYVAESLLCAADSTIEPASRLRNANGDIIKSSVDGEGYRHVCKNPDFLFQVAARSEQQAFRSWDWKQGDTVEGVFG